VNFIKHTKHFYGSVTVWETKTNFRLILIHPDGVLWNAIQTHNKEVPYGDAYSLFENYARHAWGVKNPI
jgi:hypothetical protein